MNYHQIKINNEKYKVTKTTNGNGNTTIKVRQRYRSCELCKRKVNAKKLYWLQDRRFVITLIAKPYCKACATTMKEIMNNVRTTYNQNKWYVGK